MVLLRCYDDYVTCTLRSCPKLIKGLCSEWSPDDELQCPIAKVEADLLTLEGVGLFKAQKSRFLTSHKEAYPYSAY